MHLPLSGPLAHQSFNETHLSTDLNTPKDITDVTSLTLIHTLDQDINSVQTIVVVTSMNHNQSTLNSINLNNHASNDLDCESEISVRLF
jgi:hypothetical protein